MAGKRLDEMTISASKGMGAVKECIISVHLTAAGGGNPGINACIKIISVETGEIAASREFTYPGMSKEAAGQLAMDNAHYLAQDAGFGHVREVYANYETISDY